MSAKGLANRPTQAKPGYRWMYVYPMRIYTKWPEGKFRFGTIGSFYMAADGSWYATTFINHLTKDFVVLPWQTNGDGLIGKQVFRHSFTGDILHTSYDPKTFTHKGSFGVITNTAGPTALMRVDRKVIEEDEDFRQNGEWTLFKAG